MHTCTTPRLKFSYPSVWPRSPRRVQLRTPVIASVGNTIQISPFIMSFLESQLKNTGKYSKCYKINFYKLFALIAPLIHSEDIFHLLLVNFLHIPKLIWKHLEGLFLDSQLTIVLVFGG